MEHYDIARFWSKVDVGQEGDCWPWREGLTDDGYGQFRVLGENERAHRVAFTLFTRGKIDGLVIRHKCDNRSCCNPFHLESGTHLDNVLDRVARRRSAIGEGNGRHVLTEPDVLQIRASADTVTVLATRYGVDRATIRAVLSGRSWRYLL